MNLVKRYIEEVISVTRSKCKPDYIHIKLVAKSYGKRHIFIHTATDEEWEKEQEQGYYMA